MPHSKIEFIAKIILEYTDRGISDLDSIGLDGVPLWCKYEALAEKIVRAIELSDKVWNRRSKPNGKAPRKHTTKRGRIP